MFNVIYDASSKYLFGWLLGGGAGRPSRVVKIRNAKNLNFSMDVGVGGEGEWCGISNMRYLRRRLRQWSYIIKGSALCVLSSHSPHRVDTLRREILLPHSRAIIFISLILISFLPRLVLNFIFFLFCSHEKGIYNFRLLLLNWQFCSQAFLLRSQRSRDTEGEWKPQAIPRKGLGPRITWW
jgi:hypothetical protein